MALAEARGGGGRPPGQEQVGSAAAAAPAPRTPTRPRAIDTSVTRPRGSPSVFVVVSPFLLPSPLFNDRLPSGGSVRGVPCEGKRSLALAASREPPRCMPVAVPSRSQLHLSLPGVRPSCGGKWQHVPWFSKVLDQQRALSVSCEGRQRRGRRSSACVCACVCESALCTRVCACACVWGYV